MYLITRRYTTPHAIHIVDIQTKSEIAKHDLPPELCIPPEDDEPAAGILMKECVVSFYSNYVAVWERPTENYQPHGFFHYDLEEDIFSVCYAFMLSHCSLRAFF